MVAEVSPSAPSVTKEHSLTFDLVQMSHGPDTSRPLTVAVAPAASRDTSSGHTPMEHCHG